MAGQAFEGAWRTSEKVPHCWFLHQEAITQILLHSGFVFVLCCFVVVLLLCCVVVLCCCVVLLFCCCCFFFFDFSVVVAVV